MNPTPDSVVLALSDGPLKERKLMAKFGIDPCLRSHENSAVQFADLLNELEFAGRISFDDASEKWSAV